MIRPTLSLRLLAGSTLAVLSLSPLALAQTQPNGVASGETTSNSSLLWARPTVAGPVTFEYSTDPAFGSILGNAVVTADGNVPVKAAISGLAPGTQYYFRAIDSSGTASAGKLKTAAAAGAFNGFRFGVSGDWRGDTHPQPFAKNVPSRNLDLWVALGDTIYADVASQANGGQSQSQTVQEFRNKHEEVHTARGGLNALVDLRASTSMFATIDDHEVTNDFQGAAPVGSDPRFAAGPGPLINDSQLYQNGLQAFQEWHPINPQNYSGTGQSRLDGKPELYRSQQYGKDATVIITDARSFRDQGLPAADPLNPASIGAYLGASFTPGRTMLGTPQLDAVKQDLLQAQQNQVTWKFVHISEPVQNLGVLNASDRYEGYAAERAELLRFVNDNNIQNVVFVAADIHGTLVNNLTYQNGPFQPQIQTNAFEITTGSGSYDAPFGPTVAGLAAQLGLPGSLPLTTYLALPRAQQEAYIQGVINSQIQPLGYDPLGLQGSSIDATLLQGSYTATNTFGWTEFTIDPVSQYLTVTTFGIPWYSDEFALANPTVVAGFEPQIVSQFVVRPIPAPGAMSVVALAGLVAARRRRA
jgi:alkaline phosphatase D